MLPLFNSVSITILDPLIDRDPVNVDIDVREIVAFHSHDYDKNVNFDILISHGSSVTTVIP